MARDHLEIATRWQHCWDQHGTFRTARRSGQPKGDLLDMFPYPSGVGLHVGHRERYGRHRHPGARLAYASDVLHRMDWEVFGLTAEQHAIDWPEGNAHRAARRFRRGGCPQD